MTTEDPKALALVENVQRVDLHALEIARSLRELIDDKGLTQEEAGTLIGKSQAHVARLLGLLKLPSDVLEELPEHRHVGPSLLLELAEIADPDMQRALWQQAKNGLTIRELRQAKQEVKMLLASPLPVAAEPPKPEADSDPALVTAQLSEPTRSQSSHDRAVKGIRKHVLAIQELHGQGMRLNAQHIEALQALKRDIEALLTV